MNINKKDISIIQMVRHAAQAEKMLKQLANAKRLLILCQLVEGEETVLQLARKVGLSQSALSQHLIKMKAAGLVGSEKRGKKAAYFLKDGYARIVLSTLHDIYCR